MTNPTLGPQESSYQLTLLHTLLFASHLWRGVRVSYDWRDSHHDPGGEVAALLLVRRGGVLERDGVELRQPVAPGLQRRERLGLAATTGLGITESSQLVFSYSTIQC